MEVTAVALVKEIKAIDGGKNANDDNKLVVLEISTDGDLDGKIASTIGAESVQKKKKNRIQVSNTKKPFLFYLNLAKKYINQYNDVELSALGMAIPTVVTISEILKENGLATLKKIETSTIPLKDEDKGRLITKAKIEIVLEKVAEELEEPTGAIVSCC
ncbi:hypothetical protein HS088_TW13G01483 [Tripterygium wilfordii]|uniref:DNA/RNA-binding protein Alba-like domain-containing protein n=1 Tax=Tripterygium wilfordii TaxID=458696 RepID=A0A7J7CWR4_TRIWF|nr:uncharacterized protein At2g34160-like [Tripterygium wilfordii]XP_038721661.1 uncharacterized protein At2g34160-like [Tripterygium wilfordii]KAF5738582.1 hypothetical protein HS088_TW13G01483 [Tripterygium wilfordii]